VLAVEDDRAATIVRTLLDQIALSLPPYQRPAIQTIPIGTFDSVIKFVRNSSAIVPSTTGVYGLIDKDVEAENKVAWTTNENYDQLNALKATKDRVRYLPWTPEVGIALRFSSDTTLHRAKLRELFGNDTRIDLDEVALAAVVGASGGPQRKQAKKWLDQLVDSIVVLRAEVSPIVEQRVLSYFANAEWTADSAQFKALLMPLITK
jgi:hypothetical protein